MSTIDPAQSSYLGTASPITGNNVGSPDAVRSAALHNAANAVLGTVLPPDTKQEASGAGGAASSGHVKIVPWDDVDSQSKQEQALFDKKQFPAAFDVSRKAITGAETWKNFS